MRPASIVWFEGLYLATIPVGLIAIAVNATERGADWRSSLLMPALVLVAPLLVALRVSRGRSNFAKWLLAAWFAMWLAAVLVSTLLRGAQDLSVEPVVVIALQAAGLGLLFTASARAWLAGGKGAPSAGPVLKGLFE